MAFSLLASAAIPGGQNGATSAAIDTSGATLIVIGEAHENGSSPTLTDSKGNTWTALNLYNTSGPQIRLRYCINPTVGTGHTFSASGTNIYAGGFVQAFSGSGTFQAQSGAALATPGNITPPQDGTLFVTLLASNPGGPHTVDSGFTRTGDVNFTSGANYGIALAYLVQGTAAALNPTWTTTGGTYVVSAMATFAPAAGGSSTPVALTDSAAGSDALSLKSLLGLTDSAAGSDSLSIQSLLGLTDSAVGTDSMSIQVLLGLTDSAVGSDSMGVNTGAGPDLAAARRRLMMFMYRHFFQHNAYTPPAESPYLVANLNFEGTDGSTTIVDSKGHTVTASGAVAIRTAQFFAGASSLRFTGAAADKLQFATSSDWVFALGDFAIKCYIRPDAVSGVQMIASGISSSFYVNGSYFYLNGSALEFTHFTDTNNNLALSGGTLTANTWAKVEIRRVGTVFTLLVNDVVVSTVTSSIELYNPDLSMQIGYDPRNAGRVFAGYMDNLQIFKGGIS